MMKSVANRIANVLRTAHSLLYMVEEYLPGDFFAFSLNHTFKIGEASTIPIFDSPDVGISVRAIRTNAPGPDLFYIKELKAANRSLIYSEDSPTDAFSLSPLVSDYQPKWAFPIMPSNKVRAVIKYTGVKLPPGFTQETFTFCLTLKGKVRPY